MGSALLQSGEFTNPRSRPEVRFGKTFFQTCWTVFFLVVCSGIYMQKSRGRDAAISELSFRLQETEKMRAIAIQEREDLQLRLQSQSDPAWIEMVLMRDLGVVPEGWIKVQFTL